MGGHEDCYPGSLLYQLHYGVEGVGSPFYTPAIFCPYGYATAAAWTASSYGGPPPGDGESAYYCCPLSYSLGASGNCYSTVTTGQVVTSESLNSSVWIKGQLSTVTGPTVTVVVWSIQIRYHDSDLKNQLIATATTITATVAASLTLSQTSPGSTTMISSLSAQISGAKLKTVTASPQPSPAAPGVPTITSSVSTPLSGTNLQPIPSISIKTKIVIGVMVPSGLIAVLLVIFLCFKGRKKGTLWPGSQFLELHANHKIPKAELEASAPTLPELHGSARPFEKHSTPIYELDAIQQSQPNHRSSRTR
ncbi:MAG: hypothetical protein MMC33_003360 [Icmadophila ericetorum]|nr:hypothetical protein [Icmadophila ericetorum]